MGGSAPGIVFADAEVDTAVEPIYWQRFANCGQTCDGLKRLIVEESIAEELIEELKGKLAKATLGDPLHKQTDFGPLSAERQLSLLEEQVEDALEKGAEAVIGGQRSSELEGYFFQPTILTNVNTDMRVWQEEVFGPVLPVMTFETEEEAVRLANDTQYGLGAYVYTEDDERAVRIAERLESGMVSLNGTNYVLPMNPFGGYKKSGLGREHGKYGLRELCQIKLISKDK